MPSCARTVEPPLPGHVALVVCDLDEGHQGPHHGLFGTHPREVEMSWADEQTDQPSRQSGEDAGEEPGQLAGGARS